MSVVRVEIQLVKPNRTYLCGETIYGRVNIYNESEIVQKYFNRLFILFYGGATTDLKGSRVRRGIRIVSKSSLLQFSKRRPNDDETIGQEFYLDKRLYLSLPKNRIENSSNEIPPGMNTIPFEFQLPDNLLSSFFGTHGIISYDISISFRLINSSDSSTRPISNKVDFQVTRIVDLNCLNPYFTESRTFEFDKVIWIGSSNYGQGKKLKTVVNLPVRCYVPEEYLQCSVRMIQNSTKVIKVEKFRLEFVQEIHYKASTGSLTDYHILANLVNFGNVCESEVACSLYLPKKLIPSTSSWPTTSSSCPLINISYSLAVKLKLEVDHAYVKMGKVPIFIGTVPFSQQDHEFGDGLDFPIHQASTASGEGYSPILMLPSSCPRYEEKDYIRFFQREPRPRHFLSMEQLQLHDNNTEDNQDNEHPPPTYDEAMEMIRKSMQSKLSRFFSEDEHIPE